MRQLRKTHMEYEERNAALQKHVESMRAAVERLEGDVMQERGRNSLLHQHLETLRQALTSSFCSLPLPGENRRHVGQQQDFPQLHKRISLSLLTSSANTVESPLAYQRPKWLDMSAL